MKAALIEGYGKPEVLKIKDVPEPKIGDGDILVKVVTTAVTAADSRIRAARFPVGYGLLARIAFGITKPRVKVLGSSYSGIVEKVGQNVTQFHVGDEVCGMTGIGMGTYAEYIKVSQYESIALKPTGVSHEDAAGLLFGGTAALYFIRDKLSVKKGETVAINGASGAVGTSAVQLAKYLGAKVTGVTSTGNTALVKGLGAEHVMDYKKQSLAESGKNLMLYLMRLATFHPK